MKFNHLSNHMVAPLLKTLWSRSVDKIIFIMILLVYSTYFLYSRMIWVFINHKQYNYLWVLWVCIKYICYYGIAYNLCCSTNSQDNLGIECHFVKIGYNVIISSYLKRVNIIYPKIKSMKNALHDKIDSPSGKIKNDKRHSLSRKNQSV